MGLGGGSLLFQRMGLGGGLVKRVFSKHRSPPRARDATVDKSRWSLSRLSLCGDDFDSVHAEVNDLTSLECSELTVTQQTMVGDSENSPTVPSSESTSKGGERSDEGVSGDSNADKDDEGEGTEASGMEFQLEKNAAALIIQSAFRRFQAKRQQEQRTEDLEECQDTESPSRASLGTSVEVQVGEDSVKNLPICGENTDVPQQIPHKVKRQTSKLKEEWDDSPVSSNISKLRVQKRLEAMTRRERALAYAFSQQLRVCSNKKNQARHDLKESNMSWTWLERWMATRRPEHPPSEGRQLQHYVNHRPSILRKKFDVDLEESCGSNDVPVSCENSVIPSLMNLKGGYKAVKNRLKAPKDAKRRINAPKYHHTAPPNKVIKSLREMEKEKQKKIQGKETGDLPA